MLNSLPFSSCRDKECGEAGHENKGNAPEGKLLCHMPWKRLVINPAGNVCPACHCRVMVGNVLDNRLSEIWNNDKMALYRDAIVRRRYDGVCNKDCVNGFIAEELRGLR